MARNYKMLLLHSVKSVHLFWFHENKYGNITNIRIIIMVGLTKQSYNTHTKQGMGLETYILIALYWDHFRFMHTRRHIYILIGIYTRGNSLTKAFPAFCI